MKKILNVFLCMGLLLQNFAFAIPVLAEELEQESIEIISITQDGKELAQENGIYQVSDNKELVANYKIKSTNNSKKYVLETKYNSNNSSSFYFYGNNTDLIYNDSNIKFNSNSPTSEITYNLYEFIDKEENAVDENLKLLTTTKFKMTYTKYDELNIANSKLYITEVSQGGNIIEPKVINENHSYGYNLNDTQNVVLKIKGENLNDTMKYHIYSNTSYPSEYLGSYTGAELKNGIQVEVPIKQDEYKSIQINIRLEIFYDTIMAKYKNDNGYDCYAEFNFSKNENLEDYTTSITYKNYAEKEILKANTWNTLYLVSSKYHNSNNALAVKVNGQNFQDKDYNVSIDIIRDNKNVYTKNLNVNGLLLNDGYNIELDGFTSSEEKTYNEIKDMYNIKTKINYTSHTTSYMYSYSEKHPNISSEIFYENGKKNLSTFRGDGSYYFSSGFAETHKDTFTKFNNMYIRYLGTDFEDNITYDYEFNYGYSDNQGGYEKGETLKTGKISGKDLNRNGLMFEVNNKNNYNWPSYRLTIKYNDEIIFYSAPVIDLVDHPTFANVSLTTNNNKNLYLRMNDYTYIATRNFPIEITISGVGFEDNKDYNVNFCTSNNLSTDGVDQECNVYTFKGKKLNDGAKINFNNKITDDITNTSFYANIDGVGYTAQGGFNINFVESSDFFPNNTPYFIDNAKDLIKNIKGKTKVNDFTKNVKVNDNGKVKIYDKTGTTEQNDYVGTGMIARISDEYDNSLLDLDVVVKGDVSGDGNISITDLVNMKQHLSETKQLTGVYEVAGQITGKEEIGITDLVKVCQSVVNGEVIE